MIKTDKNIDDIKFIIQNLRDEDKAEVIALWGENWYLSLLDSIKNINVITMYGKNTDSTDIPIAMGGFSEQFEKGEKIACVWLLSTHFVKQNKRIFFKTIGKLLYRASFKYKVMYNYIYKSNFEAKEWLEKFGFIFKNSDSNNSGISKDFEFFYKLGN